MSEKQKPRFKFPYGDKEHVIPVDLLTIERVEEAANMGIERIVSQLASDTDRRFSTVGRILHGALTRVIPDLDYETFVENFDATKLASTLQVLLPALDEAATQFFGGMAEVEAKKESTPEAPTTPTPESTTTPIAM